MEAARLADTYCCRRAAAAGHEQPVGTGSFALRRQTVQRSGLVLVLALPALLAVCSWLRHVVVAARREQEVCWKET